MKITKVCLKCGQMHTDTDRKKNARCKSCGNNMFRILTPDKVSQYEKKIKEAKC